MTKDFNYIFHLDAVRAFAVLLVLVHHWLPEINGISFEMGKYGVDLFFVISGFLITSILIKQRKRLSEVSAFRSLKQFYMRRTLRIFPIYYLFLLFFVFMGLIFNLWSWHDYQIKYYFFYFSNFLFFIDQSINLTHLWSLSVEEQFYLIWPWIILFIPQSKMKMSIIFFIFVGFLTHFIGWRIDFNVRTLPFANFHTLGVGALLAYYYVYFPEKLSFFTTKLSIFVPLSIFLFVLLYYVHTISVVTILLFQLMICTTAVLIVLKSVYGFTGLLGKIATNSSIVHFGKISYGIYLYHKPIPMLLNLFWSKIFHTQLNSVLCFIATLILTLLISHFSWIVIEKPILRLKDKYFSN